LDVELVLGNVGTGSGMSGANITTDFIGASSIIRPSASGQAEYSSDAPAGNVMYVYKAVPTITLEALPSTLCQPAPRPCRSLQLAALLALRAGNK